MYFYLNSYLNNVILLSLLQIIKRYGCPHVVPKEVRSFMPTQKQKRRRTSLRLSLQVAGAVGIEPTSTVLETAVLPLNYAPISVVLKTTEIHYI